MILAADNLHPLNPVVADALKRLDARPIQDLAKRCELPGVEFIDINPGYLSRRYEDRMAFMVEAVQEVSSLRLILDSPSARVLARGLAVCRDKPVLNGLSLEPAKLAEILPLAVHSGASLVLLLMDERSRVPASFEAKAATAVELRDRAIAAGMQAIDLTVDPIMPNITWPDAYFQVNAVINLVRLLTGWSIFPEPMTTMVGLSNLLSGQRSRFPESLELHCLSLLSGAGLNVALANVLRSNLMSTFRLIRPMIQEEPSKERTVP
jgi:5-methyltetrahydrofolate corrinoid/iron sulfur protein methyltransferase